MSKDKIVKAPTLPGLAIFHNIGGEKQLNTLSPYTRTWLTALMENDVKVTKVGTGNKSTYSLTTNGVIQLDKENTKPAIETGEKKLDTALLQLAKLTYEKSDGKFQVNGMPVIVVHPELFTQNQRRLLETLTREEEYVTIDEPDPEVGELVKLNLLTKDKNGITMATVKGHTTAVGMLNGACYDPTGYHYAFALAGKLDPALGKGAKYLGIVTWPRGID